MPKASTIFICCCAFIFFGGATGFCSDKTTGFILADSKWQVLSQQNQTAGFVPASIIKILTSLAAVHTLKATYRFPTQYYLHPDSKDIYIKGFGDPLFISEMIDMFSRTLANDFPAVRHIICDNSYFSNNVRIPGKGSSLNPYDSYTGALSANFNTINFKWDDATGQFISAEPQTPLLSIFQKKIKNTGMKNGRIVLSLQESIEYPGLLIQYFLNKYSLEATGKVLTGKLPTAAEGVMTFYSPFNIIDAIQRLLEYSNNFIANQLLLSMGAAQYGPPATLEKGIMVIKGYAGQSLKIHDLQITEGSGLSRDNRLTPNQMMIILKHFSPYYQLLNQKGNDYYKTGTLLDIRTRAGYLMGKDNKLYPYVIMVNKKEAGYRRILKGFKEKVSKISEKKLVDH